MKKFYINILTLIRQIFFSSFYNWQQLILIFFVGLAFIWLPQQQPNDWELNTKYFWSNFPQTYLNNPNLVYPPWGLILLGPYYLIQASGARVLSVFTIGWFTYKRRFPFFYFLILVFSPYFLWAMVKSNVDILVIILPILLWEYSKGKRWENILRGISLSLLLVKPQCNIFLIIYLLWESRSDLKKEAVQLAILGLIILPISFMGSPPLIIQWLSNISFPSVQNRLFWAANNISLTARYNFYFAFGILFLAGILLYLFVKLKLIFWKHDQTLFLLLLCSMQLLPYSSQQSFSGGLILIPSWPGLIYQWLGVYLGFVSPALNEWIPLWTFSVSLFSILSYSFIRNEAPTPPP